MINGRGILKKQTVIYIEKLFVSHQKLIIWGQ